MGGRKGVVMGLRSSWRGSVDSSSMRLCDYIIKAIPHQTSLGQSITPGSLLSSIDLNLSEDAHSYATI